MKLDKCTMNFEGDLIIFGGHYNLIECRKIIKEEEYDEPLEWDNPEPIYAKFGFTYNPDEGEVSNGWKEFSDYKKGRIKATRMSKT